jgi:hypothetical protein
VDKPYDRSFKDYVDQAPELFLEVLRRLPLPPGWQLRVLRPETSPPVMMPDFVARQIGPNGECVTIHLEYGAEVYSLMILIRPGAPERIPAVGVFGNQRTQITHEFDTIKLWEVSAAPILDNASMRHLFALVPALACNWDEVQRVCDAVLESCDEAELSRLLLTLGLKYNQDKIEQLIGRRKMGFAEVLWEGSSLLKDMREKAISSGLAEGMAEGLAKGKTEEARRLLRAVLADRFPGLESMPELDRIAQVSDVESLLIEKVLKLTGRADVECAIRESAAAR